MNWEVFAGLPGAATRNFEMLCRHLMHRHYASCGDFRALANQPGVEFHLRLTSSCALGDAGRWYGWQCRWYEIQPGRPIGAARRAKIEKAIADSLQEVPGITDWVLWTRHPLTPTDQAWFYGLAPVARTMTLRLWTGSNVEEHLVGPGELYRSTYFGDLVLTPEELLTLHEQAVAPIRFRWLPEAHQPVEAERSIRRMLGDNAARSELQQAKTTLDDTKAEISRNSTEIPDPLAARVTAFVELLDDMTSHLVDVATFLEAGNWQSLRQLESQVPGVTAEHRSVPRNLRSARHPLSMYATNALDDVNTALAVLTSLNDELNVAMAAIVADAGNGKTQLAAQVTTPDGDRPAGILLHGRQLASRTSLDSLAGQVAISGRPCPSVESLLAALDAAGERAHRRLPLVIDGLNEAEDPREWAGHLSSLGTMLPRYPHVLLVCTVRGSFANECLPDNVRRLKVEGFAADRDAAVERYFDYYNIDATDADIPDMILNHPLALRIFCDVTNPDRKKTVGVESMPGSLAAMFDQYIDQIADRISQLSPNHFRICPPDVRTALEKIGHTLWLRHANGVEMQRLRGLIDTDTRWDCSMVRMLEQEGLLLRTPIRDSPGQSGMLISYDALAGHIVASALIAERDRDTMAAWLSSAETTAALAGTGERRQPLAEDVFAALASLLPRRHERQLWSLVDENLRGPALLLATELEPKFLDGATLDALKSALLGPTSQTGRLLDRLRLTRTGARHPLNATFLDAALRQMDVAQRDSIWTEWTRRNWRDLVRDLREFEDRWSRDEHDPTRDALRAAWTMWILTSTVRDLRDHATRSLYQLGLKDSGLLFKMGIESLDISDTYVPQRTLAACYGVAMARQIHDAAYADALPGFLEQLRAALIGPDATHPNNDWLMRLYVQGMYIHSARYYPEALPPDLGSGELDFAAGPTFAPIAEGHPNVDEAGSPIRMDFENYTIGRLFDDRRNYDRNHTGHKEALAEIRGAVWALGWRQQGLGTTDRALQDQRYGYGADRAGQLERYGKKYGWIGFYNTAGRLQSRGELRPRSERLPDLGIDPSFPLPVPPLPIGMPDWAVTTPASDEEWVTSGTVSVPDDVLRPVELDGHAGPWVAVGGHLETEMQAPGRRVWGLIKTILVDQADGEEVAEAFTSHPYPGRSWIPEGPDDYYTFAGEIPWHPTFGHIHEDDEPYDPYRRTISIGGRKIDAEVLVHGFGWEGYHSPLNAAAPAVVPSRELSRAMDLRPAAQSFHQYDATARPATLSYGPPLRMTGHILYIREDILRTYARGRDLVSLWWGERLPRPYPHEPEPWLTDAQRTHKVVWRRVIRIPRLGS
ncbi:hypothetical protein [Pilimelia anulata]|uniref:hypothetical protein n=1 Tax=Pilimelia anulata TaxID=53371 RepID=UPI00166579EA|nr:hypothetical protein [Pilimelia anulata]